MSKSEINITPGASVLKTIGNLPLKGWECVAELIDNSLDGLIDTNNNLDKSINVYIPTQTEITKNLKPLSIMDFKVDRNAFGRQVDSFSGNLCLEFDNTDSFNGLFIRAPKISKLGKGIKILATYKKQPVMITNGRHFATTFHPEIGDDCRIHKHIMGKINE